MKQITKRILSLAICLIMAVCMAVPAFAGGSVSGNTGYISDGTTTVTSSDIPASLLNRMNITTIYVPDSVTTISSGAFSGLDNLQTVYIDNVAGNVSVAAGALPSGASIVYTGVAEEPVTEDTQNYTTARQTYRTTRRTTTRRATAKATTEETTEETTKKKKTTTETETELVVYTNVTDVVTDDTGVSSGTKTGRTVAIAAVAVVAVSAVGLVVLKLKKD